MTAVYIAGPPSDAPAAFQGKAAALTVMLGRLGYEVLPYDGTAGRGDIVAHLWPRPELLVESPLAVHVETGVGYLAPYYGARRIYESRIWQAFHWGMSSPGGAATAESPAYSFVIPMAFDETAWTPKSISGDYLLYAGRLNPDKGLYVLRDVLDVFPGLRLVVAGPGDAGGFLRELGSPGRVEYVGMVTGSARDALYGGALAMMCPTQYLEPFGASAVEAMMCGTPVVASDWGGFTETVRPGVTGFRCRTLRDWVIAVKSAASLDRQEVAVTTREQFGYRSVGPMYDAVFRQLLELYGDGWKTLRSETP